MLVILCFHDRLYTIQEDFTKSHADSQLAKLAIFSQTNDIFTPFFC